MNIRVVTAIDAYMQYILIIGTMLRKKKNTRENIGSRIKKKEINIIVDKTYL
jgi:hypothetical protein